MLSTVLVYLACCFRRNVNQPRGFVISFKNTVEKSKFPKNIYNGFQASSRNGLGNGTILSNDQTDSCPNHTIFSAFFVLYSYSRETPRRFKSQILQPYVGTNGDVDVEALNKLLTNIGAGEHRLSNEEQQVLLEAAGSSTRCITVQKVLELIE